MNHNELIKNPTSLIKQKPKKIFNPFEKKAVKKSLEDKIDQHRVPTVLVNKKEIAKTIDPKRGANELKLSL